MNFALVRCSKAETDDGTATWRTSLILATVWLAYLYLFKQGFVFSPYLLCIFDAAWLTL
jgi:hypothetical protein